jgi:hypothetical protein
VSLAVASPTVALLVATVMVATEAIMTVSSNDRDLLIMDVVGLAGLLIMITSDFYGGASRAKDRRQPLNF